jgi:hypothetical protein
VDEAADIAKRATGLTGATRGTGLTGAAGEYYVAAELSLRGWLSYSHDQERTRN